MGIHCVDVGRLGADPRMWQNEKTKIATMRIAVETVLKDGKKRVDWFTLKAFNSLATVCEKYLFKGRLIKFEGEWRSRQYTTQDGRKGTEVFIMASRIEFLDNKKRNQTQAPNDEPPPPTDEELAASLEDVPF